MEILLELRVGGHHVLVNMRAKVVGVAPSGRVFPVMLVMD